MSVFVTASAVAIGGVIGSVIAYLRGTSEDIAFQTAISFGLGAIMTALVWWMFHT